MLFFNITQYKNWHYRKVVLLETLSFSGSPCTSLNQRASVNWYQYHFMNQEKRLNKYVIYHKNDCQSYSLNKEGLRMYLNMNYLNVLPKYFYNKVV